MTTPTHLRAPGPNATARKVLRLDRGHVLLDMTAITPAARWFTVDELQAVNGTEALALGWKLPNPFDSGLVYDQPQPAPAEYIYPMPALYPRDVFLAAANYYLHNQVLYLDPVAVEKSARMIAKAG